MICAHCATGGDLSATLPRTRPGADQVASNRYTGLQRRIRNAHGKCKGGTFCDCQHVGTPYDRKAGVK